MTPPKIDESTNLNQGDSSTESPACKHVIKPPNLTGYSNPVKYGGYPSRALAQMLYSVSSDSRPQDAKCPTGHARAQLSLALL